MLVIFAALKLELKVVTLNSIIQTHENTMRFKVDVLSQNSHYEFRIEW